MTASVSIIDNRKSLRVSGRRVPVTVSAPRPVVRLSINGGPQRSIELAPTLRPVQVSGPRLPLTLAQTQRIVLVSRSGSAAVVLGEIPGGVIDGSNATFTTAGDFVPGNLSVRVNGLTQQPGTHFNTSGRRTILLADSPEPGDLLQVDYVRHP